MYAISFHPSAVQDMDSAREWYDAQKPALGDRFIDTVFKAVLIAQDFPFSYAISIAEVRRIPIHGFPYHAYYFIQEKDILILAIAHMHRDPDTIQTTLATRT
jgi:plasmid stabilization system protein ParE